jgi:hypothetical protein
MPYGEITIDRALVRSCVNADVARVKKRRHGKNWRMISSPFEEREFLAERREDVNA